MRFVEDLCPPALLYLIFLVVQLGLDASLGMWITFVVKAFLGFATVAVLDVFCDINLGVVSWFLVAAPFLITALGTAIAMGTGFDQTILLQLKEDFVGDPQAKSADDIGPSNTVKYQAEREKSSSGEDAVSK
jgi:hypothetical protein